MTEQDAMNDWAVMEAHFSTPQVTKNTISDAEDQGLCIECNKSMFTCREGMVCTSCGYSETNIVSENAEWTSGPSLNGEKTKNASRVGAPGNSDLFSNQLGTIIKDKYPGYRSKLSKRNLRNINSKDRCLFHAYKHFDKAQYVHRLPSTIVDRAKYIYKGISEKTLTRGDKRKGIMGNCLLQSLQENKVPRTTREVASMFDIEVKDITRMRNTFFEHAGEIIKTAKAEDMSSGVILGFNFDLKLRMKVLKRTGKHLEIVKKSKRLSGKTPSGIMAATIWTVLKPLDVDLSEEDVAKSCGVSTPTMVKLFHLIQDLFEKQ
jgi:transcription initiation factor TFIIIB Brf1 subunit/transcription initiation factor TFIIB